MQPVQTGAGTASGEGTALAGEAGLPGVGAGPPGNGSEAPARTLVAICPDWAVIVAGRPPSAPVAVVSSNRVTCLSPAARAQGARVGQRRREAQARWPNLEILASDPGAEARCWEPVVAAVEAFAPGVEVLEPGQVALACLGPSRYFGGDRALALKVAAAVEGAVARVGHRPAAPADRPGASSGRGPDGQAASGWQGCCRVGVADGLPAAVLAAHLAGPGSPVVVPPGRNRDFLAPLPVSVLALSGLRQPGPARGAAEPAALVDLLVRLGVRSLGELAALPAPAVLGRFGAEGLWAHRFANGWPTRPLQPRPLPADWAVSERFDPPAEQAQAVAFVARALAERLQARLGREGLVCTRLAIEVETERGERLRRSWRQQGAIGAGAVAERARWQLEAWAQARREAGGAEAPSRAGTAKLSLVPEEVCPDDGLQLGLWGQEVGVAGRVARALARVQGLLGPGAVLNGVLQGGRDYAGQVRLAPWEGPAPGHVPAPAASLAPPWPGRLPGLAPALVHRPPLVAQVTDRAGQALSVSGRGLLSAPPAWLVVGDGRGARRSAVVAWGGPWPVEERWWDGGGRRRARLQVCTAGGGAYLLAREQGRWWVEATYD